MIFNNENFNNIKKEENLFDYNETVQVSSIALLKIIRHAQTGIPIEVMGIMLGKFLNKTTVIIFDIFAMPQTGTKITVEAIDPIFQTKMLDMLMHIGKNDIIIGWYHSHPGFGCWLSSVDMNTQKSFEQLNNRSIALVIDPIQSIKGNIVLEVFRLISFLHQKEEIREINSLAFGDKNILILNDEDHGLNKSYYSLDLSFRKNLMEKITLSSIYEKSWNINFFFSTLNKNHENKTIKSFYSILKNILKTNFSSLKLKNKWLLKNFQKFKKIQFDLFFFYKIIIQNSVNLLLNEILLNNLQFQTEYL
jgi:26S proteasome regulatory subunit N11